MRVVDGYGRPIPIEPPPPPPPVQRSVGELRSARRRAGETAFQNPHPGENERAARDTYDALNETLHDDAIAPGLRAADERYAGHRRARARQDDILYLNENGARPRDLTPDEAMYEAEGIRVPDEKAGIRNLKRHRDENIPGVEHQRYLDELGEMDPAFQGALDDIEALKAREATSYSLTHNPKLNFNQAQRGAVINLGLQNGRAIGADLVDMSRVMRGTEPPPVALGPFGGLVPRLGMAPMLLDPAAAMAVPAAQAGADRLLLREPMEGEFVPGAMLREPSEDGRARYVEPTYRTDPSNPRGLRLRDWATALLGPLAMPPRGR